MIVRMKSMTMIAADIFAYEFDGEDDCVASQKSDEGGPNERT